MNTIGVSIILPTYNRINTLKECVLSVQSQSYQNWELIIIDDSSTDDVEIFIQPFILDDMRILYHKNKFKKGLPGSRNVGISISKYDLILFIEDDLILEPNMLELLLNAYNTIESSGEPVGAIAPSRPWIYDKDLSTKEYIDNFLESPCKRSRYTGIISCNFVPKFQKVMEVPDVHSCSLYPKKVITEVGGYDEKRYAGNYLYEETDLNFRIMKYKYKLYFEPKAVMYHRITTSGGCRVNSFKYGYYFVLNHIKYVTKNYGLNSFYIIPLFFLYVCNQFLKQNLFSKRLDS